MRYGFSCTLLLTFIATAVLPAGAEARCNENRLERFLEKRAFELSADEKIDLYADRVVRYYDKRDISRRRVYRMIRQWEQRWPERIYKFLRITDFQETDDRDACRVSFDYRYLAYNPRSDRVSAGVGNTTLVLADLEGEGLYQIVAEFGDVSCRGLQKFARSRC